LLLLVSLAGLYIWKLKEQREKSLIPQKNTLYVGNYEGKDILYIGTTGTEGSFDYQKIKNPQKIFLNLSNLILEDIINFKFNNAKDLLYVSLVFNDKNAVFNKIYQINLNTLVQKELWSKKVDEEDPSKKYEGYNGHAYILQVERDNYLMFGIKACHACGPPFGPDAIVVLNTKTGQEKFLGPAGNVVLNLETETIFYQKKIFAKEPCEPTPGCVNEYKTAGSVLTEKLP
jgi:hypothetical protein